MTVILGEYDGTLGWVIVGERGPEDRLVLAEASQLDEAEGLAMSFRRFLRGYSAIVIERAKVCGHCSRPIVQEWGRGLCARCGADAEIRGRYPLLLPKKVG